MQRLFGEMVLFYKQHKYWQDFIFFIFLKNPSSMESYFLYLK